MSEGDATQHAQAMADAMISEWAGGPDLKAGVAIVELERRTKGVRVTLNARRPSFFNDLLPPGGWRYDAAATASSVGAKPLCVLAIANAVNDFRLRDSARISAPDCLVHSNAHIVVSGGRIEAGRTQAVLSATGDITPDPVTDAPPIRDPFAALPLNASVVKCLGGLKKLKNLSLLTVSSGTHTLSPGDHCGVIDLSGTASLVLRPGEHRFGAGALTVRGRARLTGVDVVMVVDKLWKTSFLDESMVSLSGRQEGLLAGFVMVADRDNILPFEIDTAHVERLDGVLYAPNAELLISSQGDVARKSDWTVIVARSLRLVGNPNLFINANYDDSDIEVPGGVGPRRDTVRLVE